MRGWIIVAPADAIHSFGRGKRSSTESGLLLSILQSRSSLWQRHAGWEELKPNGFIGQHNHNYWFRFFFKFCFSTPPIPFCGVSTAHQQVHIANTHHRGAATGGCDNQSSTAEPHRQGAWLAAAITVGNSALQHPFDAPSRHVRSLPQHDNHRLNYYVEALTANKTPHYVIWGRSIHWATLARDKDELKLSQAAL